MAAERTFWRFVAATLSIALALCVVANLVSENTVPPKITLLLFGCLVALGIANSIVNPRSSPVVLTEKEEARFRRTQYVVGLAVSAILIAILILTDLRETDLTWLFAPIIVLPFALLARACFKRGGHWR